MALANKIEELKSTRGIRHSVECAYQVLYNRLSKEDQKALEDAWAKNYPVNLVVAALRSDGHKTSSDAVRAHRNGTCRCPKK
jgi:hypothetical protein